MMKYMTAVVVVLAFFSLPLSAETVYQGTDANGNTVFSDQPLENGKKIEIAPLPTYAPTPISRSNANATDNKHLAYKLSILTPKNEQTFTNDIVLIEVKLSVVPKLLPDDLFILLVNGRPLGYPSQLPIFQLTNLERGSYKIQAQIVSVKDPNNVKIQSETIIIYQQRAINTITPNGNNLAPQAPKGPQAPAGPHVY